MLTNEQLAEIERLRTRVEKTEALLIKARTEALKEAILALTIRASERNVELNDNIEPELNKARRDELLEAAKVILKMKEKS